ncbi:MAG: lysylphosphatidylglycerol synthase transmembrane domain-containing protein [Nanoarchaeota archaeon]|nr:lysylphosphatidylglycerol synthase transmembrane domain-containing protein [Nanoarchaeota archaeon]
MQLKKVLPLIGILIFIYVIYKVGIDKIINVLPDIKWTYIILSILLSFIIVTLQAWKWDLILIQQGINLDFFYILKVHLISLFYGNITPGRIGTFSKIFYLKTKTNRDLGGCISSVTLERFLDLFTVGLFALIGSGIALHYFKGIFLEFLLLFLILVVILIISLNKKSREFFIWNVFRFLVPKKYKDRARQSFLAFEDTLLEPRQIIIPIIVTIITWIGIYAQMYLIGLALNLDIPFFKFIFISSIATIVTLIPITVGGIGTSEIAITVLFNKIFQTEPAVALALAIINRIVGLIITIIGGLLSMREEKYF